jgi:predicted phosphodiesterase
MQIQLISDIHLEFPRNYEKFMDTFELKGDLLVIAGDACNLKKPDPLWNFLAKIQKKVDHILYVPGNHEYYGSSADTIKSHETLNEIYQGNCRIMNNSHIRIGKVNFYLSTLWTDPTEYAAQRLNDFYTIKGLTRDTAAMFHQKSVKKLSEMLSQKKQGYHYVVTHHLPLWECISEKYAGNPVNSCFTSDQSELIENNKIHVWMHGHSHDRMDEYFKGTRIIRNPFGYSHIGESYDYKEFVIDIK